MLLMLYSEFDTSDDFVCLCACVRTFWLVLLCVSRLDVDCWWRFDVSGFIYTCPCQRHCEINWAKTQSCLRFVQMSNQSLTCLTSKLHVYVQQRGNERKEQSRISVLCVYLKCHWRRERLRRRLEKENIGTCYNRHWLWDCKNALPAEGDFPNSFVL